MKFKIFCSGFFCLLLTLSIGAWHQQEEESYKIHVSLGVSGHNSNVVHSYLARELRSLNDIAIEDEGGRYELRVLVLEPAYETGKKVGGFVISTVILDNFDKTFVEFMVKDFIKDKPLVQESLNSLTKFCTLKLNIGLEDDLKHMCETIIAKFDTEYLEEVRRELRKTKKGNL